MISNRLKMMVCTAMLAVAAASQGAEPVTLHWGLTGTVSTQNNVVLTDCPVTSSADSDAGQWVLNSTVASYAKATSTVVTTSAQKVLQLGSTSVSAQGTVLSLSATANPIPADATINSVAVQLKTLSSQSTWSVSVDGAKDDARLVCSAGTAMTDFIVLAFTDINLTGQEVALTFENLGTARGYVYIASVEVTYTPADRGAVVATPTFSPVTGSDIYSGDQVTISSATSGAVLHYALGSDDFAVAPGGVATVTGVEGSQVTLRAYASKQGMTDSQVATATYSIKRRPITPPYSESFDQRSSLEAFTIEDAGNDGATWQYDANGAVVITHEIGANGKNDWLFTPALHLEAGKCYTMRYDVKSGSNAYPEQLAVCMGQTPNSASMTTVLESQQEISNTDYVTHSVLITPAATADYYIGFHACSPANMFRLHIDDIEVDGAINASAPAASTGMTVTNDNMGRPQALISFTTPTVTASGEALSTLTDVVITRSGTEVKRYASPQPGTLMTYTDVVPQPGEYTYIVTCSNAEGVGVEARVKSFVGINVPASPTEANVVETAPGVVSISWSAPATTIAGDAIDPSLIRYNITDQEDNVVATAVSGTTFSGRVVEEGSQLLKSFTIKALTDAGVNEREYAQTEALAIGTPYQIPFADSYREWHARTLEEQIALGSLQGRWRVLKESVETNLLPYDADYGMMGFVPFADGDVAIYRTGKIYIPADADNPYLSFRMINLPISDNVVEVMVSDGETTDVVLTVTDKWEGWQEKLVNLNDYKGKTVRVSFKGTAITAGTINTAIDALQVSEMATVSVSLQRVRVPLEMDLKRPHTATVDVVNDGLQTAETVVVQLMDGEQVCATATTGVLARDGKQRLTFTLNPQTAGIGSYYARALIDDVVVAESVPIEVAVLEPLYVPVKNLTAEQQSDGVHICWSPLADADNDTPVTETFERYDEYVINNAGWWTFLDVDGKPTYGINNGIHSFPNMASPMAYIVMNNTIPTLDVIGTMTFDAHSGNQYLASFSVSDGETFNNDWLISPRLNGKEQTISFFARAMAIGNHEKFEFLTSTTGTQTYHFVKRADGEEYAGRWTEFSYTVPEGTKYFAIRCVSLDRYAFFVDDITYTPAPEELGSLVGYDVLRDGVKLNVAPITETEYVDATAGNTSHTYRVEAVMPRGNSEGAEVYLAQTGVDAASAAIPFITIADGILHINCPDVCDMYVTDISGVKVASISAQTADICLLPGIYVVRAGETIQKVVIK